MAILCIFNNGANLCKIFRYKGYKCSLLIFFNFFFIKVSDDNEDGDKICKLNQILRA